MVFAEACWGIKPPLQINLQKIKELKKIENKQNIKEKMPTNRPSPGRLI